MFLLFPPLRHFPGHPSSGQPPGPEASHHPPPRWLARCMKEGAPSPLTARFAGDGEQGAAIGVECVGRKVGSVGVCPWVLWCAGWGVAVCGRCAPATNPPGTPGGGPYGPDYRGGHEPVPCPGGPAVSRGTGVGNFMRARAAPLWCLPSPLPPNPMPRRPSSAGGVAPRTFRHVSVVGQGLRPVHAWRPGAARPVCQCMLWVAARSIGFARSCCPLGSIE